MQSNIKNKLLNKVESIRKKQKENNRSHLHPERHPQKDFFIADIFDTVSFRSDIASMEYPLFALKGGDKRTRTFKLNNFKTTITANAEYGLATIHDKDIWIYCISKLCQAIYEKKETSQIVRFTIYDYLVTTNRTTSGRDYERTKDCLDRLSGTRITTEIETDKKKEARGFGLIDSWKIVEEKDGRMLRIEVTLPEWLYRSVISKAVLKISPEYFRLRKPLDRRIYELARKHCGYQPKSEIGIDKLYDKSGSRGNIRLFRQDLKALAESNELPDYKVKYDREKDKITFINRGDNIINII